MPIMTSSFAFVKEDVIIGPCPISGFCKVGCHGGSISDLQFRKEGCHSGSMYDYLRICKGGCDDGSYDVLLKKWGDQTWTHHDILLYKTVIRHDDSNDIIISKGSGTPI
jgi:hypothetical protein